MATALRTGRGAARLDARVFAGRGGCWGPAPRTWQLNCTRSGVRALLSRLGAASWRVVVPQTRADLAVEPHKVGRGPRDGRYTAQVTRLFWVILSVASAAPVLYLAIARKRIWSW